MTRLRAPTRKGRCLCALVCGAMAAIFVQLSENDPALDAAQLLVNIKHGSNAEAKVRAR